MNRILAVAFGFLAVSTPLRAQTVPGLDASLTKLFGNNTAFTATATARILDPQEKETMSMPIQYALLDGKMRSEVDMTQVKSKDLDGTAAGSLKQIGMDRMISIVRPDRKSVMVIYPTLRAYAETPLTNAPGDVKIETSKIGQETVDGHPCVKNKVIITSPSGTAQEGTMWNATDLKDFPVRLQIKQPDGTLLMTYSNLKFDKPDAKLFEAPPGFEKYNSVEQMTQAALMKMLAK